MHGLRLLLQAGALPLCAGIEGARTTLPSVDPEVWTVLVPFVVDAEGGRAGPNSSGVASWQRMHRAVDES